MKSCYQARVARALLFCVAVCLGCTSCNKNPQGDDSTASLETVPCVIEADDLPEAQPISFPHVDWVLQPEKDRVRLSNPQGTNYTYSFTEMQHRKDSRRWCWTTQVVVPC